MRESMEAGVGIEDPGREISDVGRNEGYDRWMTDDFWVVSPRRGLPDALVIVFPGLTPWAKVCRPFGARTASSYPSHRPGGAGSL
jgi:hypothetical protein